MTESRDHRPRRILFLIPWFEMGGADKFNSDLLTVLSLRGYQFIICTTLPGKNPWLSLFEPLAEEIFLLSDNVSLAEQPKTILDLIETKNIDLILISNSYLGYLLLPLLRSRFPHLIYVDYTHMEEEHWKNGGYPRASVGYQELLDLNIVNSQHLKNWMVKRGGDSDRIEICYLNVDQESWNPEKFKRDELRESLGLSSEIPVLLYAGRIVEQKRPRVFAEVIRRLTHQEKLTFVCLVAGDGQDLPALKEFVQNHRLEVRVKFLGAVTLSRMQEIQAIADVFFLPSKMEGLPAVFFESMAMQTIPVGANVGGQKELVTPECGYLIPHSENEIDEYVTILKYLIQSPQKRRAMAAAGRERIVNHFRLDQMAKRMVELLNYAQHLSKTSPRPVVGKGLGQECAAQAIEFTRLERVAEQMRSELQHTSQIRDELRQSLETQKAYIQRLEGENTALLNQRESILSQKLVRAALKLNSLRNKQEN